jgi:MazG family protein
MNELDKLIEIVAILRGENGCNWDKKQNMETLRDFVLEETYEVIEAVNQKDYENLKEELGDLLFNICFYAQIAKEENLFQIQDVAKSISDKLIRRHPHVFGEKQDLSPEEVLKNWNRIKKEEKKTEERVSVLDGLPKALPAMMRAEKLQEKVSKIGFDWENSQGVIGKLKEEWAEFTFEIEQESIDKNKVEDELGDVLFSLVNVSRFLKVSTEQSLLRVINKFESRFRKMEELSQSKNQRIEDLSLKELDELWDKAKLIERGLG